MKSVVPLVLPSRTGKCSKRFKCRIEIGMGGFALLVEYKAASHEDSVTGLILSFCNYFGSRLDGLFNHLSPLSL